MKQQRENRSRGATEPVAGCFVAAPWREAMILATGRPGGVREEQLQQEPSDEMLRGGGEAAARRGT